jgi:hypothetical protein
MPKMIRTRKIVGDIINEGKENSYSRYRLETVKGSVEARFYEAEMVRAGMIWTGGVGGDWDTPADNLFPRLCEEMTNHHVSSLWVKYRNSNDLEEAVYDVLAGIEFFLSLGITVIGLGGWSFGGAVVVRAGVISGGVRTVITLASQSYGADIADRLPMNCSILLIHGNKDETLAPGNSDIIYRQAHEPKKIIILENAGHNMGESSEDVREIIRDWIIEELARE